MSLVAAWDVRDAAWWPRCQEKAAWLCDRGIPVHHAYRVEFHIIDCPLARVFAYDLDAAGRRYMLSKAPAKLKPFDMPLPALPPADLLEVAYSVVTAASSA